MPMLSDEAKAVGAAWFGMSRPGTSTVTLHMQENKPTPQTNAALDELIAAGLIKREPFNSFGAVQYIPLANCRPFFEWMMQNTENPRVRFPLMEPVRGDEQSQQPGKSSEI